MIIKTPEGINPICNAETANNILTNVLMSEHEIDRDKEHFWTIGLDNQNVIKYVELVSLGNLNSSIVGCRETFRMAIMKGVQSILCAHNHPSGKLKVSEQDSATCKRLSEAGEILGIQILDFIIIDGRGEYLSFRETGKI